MFDSASGCIKWKVLLYILILEAEAVLAAETAELRREDVVAKNDLDVANPFQHVADQSRVMTICILT